MAENKENLESVNWPAILHHLGKHRLVPFLGPGASLGSNSEAGLPSGGTLARSLA